MIESGHTQAEPRPRACSLTPDVSLKQHVATLRQQTYAALVNAFLQQGLMPTVREITLAVGFCGNNHTEYYLHWLRQQGFIHRQPMVCRGMHFAEYVGGSPVLGSIAESRVSSICSVVEEGLLQPADRLYALRITDHSLQSEHLCKGDILFIQPRTMETTQGRLAIVAARKNAQYSATLTRWTGSAAGYLEGIVTNIVRPFSSSIPQREEGTHNAARGD